MGKSAQCTSSNYCNCHRVHVIYGFFSDLWIQYFRQKSNYKTRNKTILHFFPKTFWNSLNLITRCGTLICNRKTVPFIGNSQLFLYMKIIVRVLSEFQFIFHICYKFFFYFAASRGENKDALARLFISTIILYNFILFGDETKSLKS